MELSGSLSVFCVTNLCSARVLAHSIPKKQGMKTGAAYSEKKPVVENRFLFYFEPVTE